MLPPPRAHLPCLAVLAAALALPSAPRAAHTGEQGRPEAGPAAAKAADEDEFARYGPVSITWITVGGLSDVRAVFAHPVLPRRVAVTTAGGLLLSGDAGQTWHPVAAAAPDKVGSILHVAFRPDSPDALYLGTDGRGVWATEDAGATFRCAGSSQTGLAGDRVERVTVWSDDPRFGTLHAFHGRAAPGVSRTFDGGRTWQVVARDYYVRNVFPSIVGWGKAGRLTVVARRRSDPELEGLFSCSSLGDLWSEALRDVVYNDGASGSSRDHVYVATADRGLLRVSNAGAVPVGPADATHYASVGVTWGPRTDRKLVYAYEPRRLGLVLSLDDMKSFTTESRGLAVGPFIRQGAHVRANANGTRFFAAVNGMLQVGYVGSRGLAVTEAAVLPPVFICERTAYEEARAAFRQELRDFPRRISAAAAARGLLASHDAVRNTYVGGDLCITARVTALRERPQAVTVDLSGLQGEPNAPLYDDGRHGDGDANDGLYGAAFRIDPMTFYNPREPTRLGTGAYGLSVRATGGAGALAGAVAVLAVYDRPDLLVFWDESNQNPFHADANTATVPKSTSEWESFAGQRCAKLTTTGKAWSAWIGNKRECRDVSGYHALSFWVRTDAGAELSVHLEDAPEFDDPVATPPVEIVKEGLVEGGKLADEYRLAVIPLERLLKGAEGFRPSRVGAVVFSGGAGPAATFWIDRVVFHVAPDSVEAEKRAASEPGRRDRRRRGEG